MHALTQGLIVILAFTVADWFAGGGLWNRLTKDNGGPLPGRPLWYMAPVLGLTLGVTLGAPYALLAAAWFLWREPQWKFLGGSLTPDSLMSWAAFALRHGLAVVTNVGVAFLIGLDVAFTASAFTSWSIVAASYGLLLSYGRFRGLDLNSQVEALRGMVYGLTVVTILVVSSVI